MVGQEQRAGTPRAPTVVAAPACTGCAPTGGRALLPADEGTGVQHDSLARLVIQDFDGRHDAGRDAARVGRDDDDCAQALARPHGKHSGGEIKGDGFAVFNRHRAIRRRWRAVQCVRSFHTAERTIDGVESMHMLRKGQVKRLDGRDAVGQAKFVKSLFGVAA